MYANRRTLDTGKTGGLIFCLPLTLEIVVFLGLCVGGKFVILLCIQKTEEIQWVGTEDGWYG